MLRLDDVIFSNGGFELAADLAVRKGSRVAVIGPSGAGKSTLVGGIAGFFPVLRGAVSWEGRDITHAAPGERPVAMLFQEGNLFPHLSVADNVGLGMSPGLKLDTAQKERVAQALERVGLGGMGARKPAQLSGGQQSRAALARVLVQKRALILLDEPFAALGPALKREMLGLVGELTRDSGATLMMVSHDPRDAEILAEDAILVAEGRAFAPRPVAEMFRDPPPALKDYLG